MTKNELQALLDVHPDDSGCAEAWNAMEVYAELVAAGVDAAVEYPRVAAHLRDCDPCAEDLAGVVALALGTRRRRRLFSW